MHPSLTRSRCMAVSVVVLGIIVSACAGGLVGSKEKKLAYFNSLEQDTLARLIRSAASQEELANRSVTSRRTESIEGSHI